MQATCSQWSLLPTRIPDSSKWATGALLIASRASSSYTSRLPWQRRIMLFTVPWLIRTPSRSSSSSVRRAIGTSWYWARYTTMPCRRGP